MNNLALCQASLSHVNSCMNSSRCVGVTVLFSSGWLSSRVHGSVCVHVGPHPSRVHHRQWPH